jgi:hypothetical protein
MNVVLFPLLAIANVVMDPERLGSWIMGPLLVAQGAWIWTRWPKKYEVWPDRLTAVFPFRRATWPFAAIREIEVSRPWPAYGFKALRHTSTMRQGRTLAIHRDSQKWGGSSIVLLSPEERGRFLEVACQALEMYRKRQGAVPRTES